MDKQEQRLTVIITFKLIKLNDNIQHNIQININTDVHITFLVSK